MDLSFVANVSKVLWVVTPVSMQSWMRAHVLVHMREKRAGACAYLTLRAPELGRGGVGDFASTSSR
eukprot:8005310-Alexandrium_andersonii.AAC.1